MPRFLRCLMVVILLLSSAVHAAGFDARYTAYQGDLNSDGRADLYVKWQPRIVPITIDDLSIPVSTSKRGVSDFVLQQSSSGTFSVVGPLSASQQASVGQWPRATGIQLAPADINYDGAVDLIVRNVASLALGVDNQLVFAATNGVGPPTRAVSLSSTLRSFYQDLGSWFLTPVTTVREEVRVYSYLGNLEQPSPYPLAPCAFYAGCIQFLDDVNDNGGWNPIDDPQQPNVQHWWGYNIETKDVTKRRYTITDSNAGTFVQALETTLASGEIKSDFYAGVMQNILNIVFGAPIVNVQQQPHLEPSAGSVNEIPAPLIDDWRWGRLLINILDVFGEVCIWRGEDANKCWSDIAMPGFPSLSLCQIHGPFDDEQPYFSYAITPAQRGLDQSNQRRSYWVSRYQDSCDPFAPSALGVVDERGLGLVTMKWLRAVAAHKGLTVNEQQLGFDIMHAHTATTDGDAYGIVHLLSKRQITDYHVAVFRSYGLPDYTFGGAPLGGATGGGFMEWFLGEWLWCPDCDRVP